MLELVLIGLGLALIGSIGLTFELGLAKVIYAPLYCHNGEQKYKKLRKENGTYTPVKEPDMLLIVKVSYILISLGFIFQIVGYAL